MVDTSQNKFLESVIVYAKDIGGIFIIANALLKEYPIIYCSEAFSHQTGFTKNEVTRQNAFLDFLYGKQTSSTSKEILRNAVLSKSKSQVEIILYDVKDHKKWMLVALLPVRDSNNVVSLLTIFFQDINHIKSPLIASPKMKWKNAVKKILNKPVWKPAWEPALKAASEKALTKSSLASLIKYYDTMFVPEYSCTLQVPKYVIKHSSLVKISWDFFILAMAFVYTAVVVPFTVCFNYRSTGMTVCDVVCSVFILIDIVATFFTSYVDDDGILVTNLKKIRFRYLKSWLTFDIFSALPYSLLYLSKDSNSKMGMMRVIMIFRMVRLIKAKDKLLQYMENGIITLGLWILFFCLCAHWMACIWFLIAKEVDLPAQRINSWLYKLTFPNQINFQDSNSSFNAINVESLSKTSSYITALYYTLSSLTTCGFGNVAPDTSAEKLFGVITMTFGCVMYAFIFGQVTNIISQLSQTSNEYLSQLRAIRQFNAIYKIPKKVRKRAENYFIATWSVTKGTEEEKIAQKFPRSLQSDLCLHIHGEVFKNESAFRHLSENALRAISRYFWTQRTAPGDKLIHRGELVSSIYFVTSGSFEVKDGDNLVGLIGPGDSFGQRPVAKPTTSICEVRANSYGEIHGVSIDAVFESLALFPGERDLFKYTLNLSFDITRKRFGKFSSVATSESNYFLKKNVTDVEHLERNFSLNQLSYSYNAENSFEVQNFFTVSELRKELSKEALKMNGKMEVIEAQMKVILDLLQKTNSSIDKTNSIWEDFNDDDFNEEWSNNVKQTLNECTTVVLPFHDKNGN